MLSAAHIGNLATNLLSGAKFAFAYELIHHERRSFEPGEFVIFPEADAFEQRLPASNAFPDIGPGIKHNGLDEKTETAHFIDAYVSLPLAKFLSVGAMVWPNGAIAENPHERIDRSMRLPVKRSDTGREFRLEPGYEPISLLRFDMGLGAKPGSPKNWQFAFALKLSPPADSSIPSHLECGTDIEAQMRMRCT